MTRRASLLVPFAVAGCAAPAADYGAASESEQATMLKAAAKTFREATRLDDAFRIDAVNTDAAQDLVAFDARPKRGDATSADDAFRMKRATEIGWCDDARLGAALIETGVEIRVRVALGGDEFVDLNYGKRACAPYGVR